MLLEIFHVGVTTQKPQKFMDNAFEVKFFGGQERKSLRKIKAHLMAEHRFCTRARAIAFGVAFFKDALKQI